MISEQPADLITSHSPQGKIANGASTLMSTSKNLRSASCILRADIVDAAFAERSIELHQEDEQSSSASAEIQKGHSKWVDSAIPRASTSLNKLDSQMLDNLSGHLAHLENQCVKLRSLLEASR